MKMMQPHYGAAAILRPKETNMKIKLTGNHSQGYVHQLYFSGTCTRKSPSIHDPWRDSAMWSINCRSKTPVLLMQISPTDFSLNYYTYYNNKPYYIYFKRIFLNHCNSKSNLKGSHLYTFPFRLESTIVLIEFQWFPHNQNTIVRFPRPGWFVC